MFAGATAFNLDKIGRRKDRPEQAKIEQIRAIVASGHHTDRDANTRFTGFISRQKVSRAEQVIIGKVDSELLSIGNL